MSATTTLLALSWAAKSGSSVYDDEMLRPSMKNAMSAPSTVKFHHVCAGRAAMMSVCPARVATSRLPCCPLYDADHTCLIPGTPAVSIAPAVTARQEVETDGQGLFQCAHGPASRRLKSRLEGVPPPSLPARTRMSGENEKTLDGWRTARVIRYDAHNVSRHQPKRQ